MVPSRPVAVEERTMLDRQGNTLCRLVSGCVTLVVAFAGALTLASGCSSSDAMPAAEGGTCPSGGGPLPGPAIDRCMGTFQEVGACVKGTVDSGAADPDAGVEMPETNVGTSSNDDDCKYMVSFTNDCVQKGGGTTFHVTLTSLTQNMAPVPDAEPYIEAFLNENHPAGGIPKTTVVKAGVYDIGPIVFDAPGKWTVRFHFFGDCSDVPDDAPHAHAAFFINVPE
jgi:hypothetical protein